MSGVLGQVIRRGARVESARARSDAALAGQECFQTGRSCSNGHLAERYTSNGACAACQRAFSAAYRRDHRRDRFLDAFESLINRRARAVDCHPVKET